MHKTDIPELGYDNVAPGMWRYFILDGDAMPRDIGDVYPSRETLLADYQRMADQFRPAHERARDQVIADLLAALQKIAGYPHIEGRGAQDIDAARKIARAAIAKAEGQS